MKKIILSLIVICVSLVCYAQESNSKYGYISYKEAVKLVPEYAMVQQTINTLKEKYEAEMKRVEDDFNSKYEEFLDGQRTFAPSILKKRQAELQELINKNIAFKAEAQRLLKQSENDANEQLYKALNAKIAQIATTLNLMFVLNTDNNAVPFVNNQNGIDLLPLIKNSLK